MHIDFFSLLGRGFAVWLLLICAEFLHGIARIFLLQPIVGDFRARQIAVFSGIVLILAISYLFVGWLHATSNIQLFIVGGLWLVLTVIFEISLGRLLDLSWERIISDYDILHGGLMPVGLVFLTVSPLIAAGSKKYFAGKWR